LSGKSHTRDGEGCVLDDGIQAEYTSSRPYRERPSPPNATAPLSMRLTPSSNTSPSYAAAYSAAYGFLEAGPQFVGERPREKMDASDARCFWARDKWEEAVTELEGAWETGE